jgi:CRP-like cAMP-binding protein
MALLILGRRFGQVSKDGLVIGIKIRHEDLAGMAALTRETVSLSIEKMERKKIIRQEKRLFIIMNPEELKKEAGVEDFFIPSLSKDVTI